MPKRRAGIALSQDGTQLFAAASDSDALTVFSRNVTTGALTFIQSIQDNLNGVDGLDGARSVAVSVDDPSQKDEILAFAEDFGLTFEILHDEAGDIMQTYQLLGLPESFLIDADGTIRDKSFVTDWFSDEKRKIVEQFLPTPES